jgi:alkylation response protein AidB-like acyl-CoA dehydrogenase
MDLRFTAEEERFRTEVRDFLSDKLTPDLRAYARRMTSVYSDKTTALAWQAILLKQGWLVPSWPTEYGGCNWSVAQHFIYSTELAHAEAPGLSPMGLAMCGPALLGHGTKAQKDYFLPRIKSADDYWCQGYSEPGSGSDLASLQTKAAEDGDDLVLTGSKIWITHGHEANMMFVLVRTDNSGKPQEGITFLLVDMKGKGVRVDPIVMLSGEHIQNQVFFDEARVPKTNVVGKIHQGWTVAKYLLEFERGGGSYAPRLLKRAGELRRKALEAGLLTDAYAQKLSQTEAEVLSLEGAELRLLAELQAGRTPGLKGSMMKIRGTELSQRLTELSIELAGDYIAPFQPHHTAPGGPALDPRARLINTLGLIGPEDHVTAMPKYLNDRAGSIYAGSNEIQRNILAKGELRL